ncbi:hypothetical protein NHX12_009027 [Muraenolepis orangiensis]|uniref:Calpain catalytic domain-containing protein n=1 Tax=Muraenolepis orangiensis TaxID=630683 RepID=A0A9Q0DPZ8_9TELE|nr:hypothetical protein NHX12_009027 [Muraenolepis orangiensis]
MSVSSEGSIPPAEDNLNDSMGSSYSGHWLTDHVFDVEMADPNGNINQSVGQDGLFVDFNFPLSDSLLKGSVTWKRPMEICTSTAPQFIVDGATRMDVCQGKLADCWFLSALASLSMHRVLLERVVPRGQGFHSKYDGSFYFRNGQLCYLRSPVQHEFWSCLLEKAYAKLKGGYEALEMGFPHEAMADMTGGVTEVVTVASLSKNLPRFLQHLLEKGALINCANCQGPLEQKNEQGIMFRHAYSLTAVEKVETTQGPVTLVRLHNPWGDTEWEGPWSDFNGPEWNTVSKEEQRRLDRVTKEDGEFWMTVSDFRKNLEVLELCHMSNSLSRPGSTGRPWHCTMHEGSWVPNASAGGPLNLGYFYLNPQFFLTLLEEDDDPSDPENTCSFLARAPGTRLSPQDLSMYRPVLSMHPIMRREVVIRGALAPGHYIIIPYTSVPHHPGTFILRVLTEKGNNAIPSNMPGTTNIATLEKSPFPHLKALPSPSSTRLLFTKHCRKDICKPLDLHHLLTETTGLAQLDWQGFMNLWYKIQMWTDIFLRFDKNGSKRLEYSEVPSALTSAGIHVDTSLLRVVGQRYTEPDKTISYPGFLYLMTKLDSMIRKFHAYDMAGRGTITISYKQVNTAAILVSI